MTRRAILGAVLLAVGASPTSAQLAVIDPANLAQAILIVDTRHHEARFQVELNGGTRVA